MTALPVAGPRRRALRRAFIRFCSVGALASAASAGFVGGVGAEPGVGESDPRAVLLLAQATRAELTTSYSGTQYISAWTDGAASTSVVDLEHEPGNGTVAKVRAAVGRPGGSVYESDRPESRVPVDPLAVPAVDGGPLDLLRHNYQLVVASVGAATAEVVARRADGTTAARFWIDRKSGLAVRREIFDTSGRLCRASAFVELNVGRVSMNNPVQTATPEAPGEKLDASAVALLRTAGWVLPPGLPGGMVLYDARRRTAGTGPVLHLSYSDGLSTVSLFVQPGRLDVRPLPGWRRAGMGGTVYVHDDGLAQRVTWSGHGKVYTVVTDAPPAAVTAMVSQLPHGDRHRGFWGRIGHGLARLGSWLDPFG